jgi:hypothetical protein
MDLATARAAIEHARQRRAAIERKKFSPRLGGGPCGSEITTPLTVTPQAIRTSRADSTRGPALFGPSPETSTMAIAPLYDDDLVP